MKPNVLDFIEHLNTVKIWIQLNIPRIEDGNNFGVSIQEETLNELGRAEDAAFGSLDNMSKYFVTRAKLLSKVRCRWKSVLYSPMLINKLLSIIGHQIPWRSGLQTVR
jgi:hypothetical protein